MSHIVFHEADYLLSLTELVLINVALSADNAVVIAMLARRLPERQRRFVLGFGGALAVAMQAVFALLIARLLLIPGLQLGGGLLLFWIAFRLMRETTEPEPGALEAGTSAARSSIVQIALANLVMSLDNVLAVASVSGPEPGLMALGFVVSGMFLFAFSAVFARLMNRFKWIVYAGGGLLASTASGMVWLELESAWRWSHKLPLVVAHHSAGTLEGRMFFTPLAVVICLGCARRSMLVPFLFGERSRTAGSWIAARLRAAKDCSGSRLGD